MFQKRLTIEDLPPVEGKSGWPWTLDWRSLSPSPFPSSDDPLVSIVTPSYNQGQFLEETIRSVLLQGYPNLEYIVIDGGSTDDSVEIIQRYEPWLAYWHSRGDRGQADAINQGMDLSTGAILGWLNSDDCLTIGALNHLVMGFARYPDAHLLYGDNEIVDEEGKLSHVSYGEQLSFETMLRTLRIKIHQPGCLWRRELIEKVGNLDIRWQVVLDREFFVRASFSCRVQYLPELVARFRRHPHSKTISQQERWLTELPAMYQEFFQRGDLSPDIKKLKGESMSSVYWRCARIARSAGKPWLAKYYAIRMLLAFPRSWNLLKSI